ncbi:hypothetical protein [Pedobacter sp. SL55]|uniref:hypothetical protein n=1 Tax=Pedobacter sp. SL55 TaxID=2995161 RepID=UPI002270C4B7|nr:hypothetical protein [Pedobacter sp. SL55]WAC41721.1 hypothetical protein OVA16_04995 [Pedobacter sp. SL55]
MKSLKIILAICLLTFTAKAQDAVLISEGNFVRGEIKGTNYRSVFIQIEEQGLKEYKAKDIKSFLWNGDTYESKPFIVGKKAAVKFFRLVEGGKVNLYAVGGSSGVEEPAQPRVKARPTFGVGMGTGGGMGGGLGGGVSINLGGGRGGVERPAGAAPKAKVFYFIEKPGTGPMQEIAADGSRTAATKNLLLAKLTGDDGLAESIKATESFDEKMLIALVKSYNEAVK